MAPSPDGKEVCKDQAENLVQYMKNLYNDRLFHDVVFEVEGEQIPAHRAILAHCSDYFMKMFLSKEDFIWKGYSNRDRWHV